MVGHVDGAPPSVGREARLQAEGDEFLIRDAVGSVDGVVVVDSVGGIDAEGVLARVVATRDADLARARRVIGIGACGDLCNWKWKWIWKGGGLEGSGWRVGYGRKGETKRNEAKEMTERAYQEGRREAGDARRQSAEGKVTFLETPHDEWPR